MPLVSLRTTETTLLAFTPEPVRRPSFQGVSHRPRRGRTHAAGSHPQKVLFLGNSACQPTGAGLGSPRNPKWPGAPPPTPFPVVLRGSYGGEWSLSLPTLSKVFKTPLWPYVNLPRSLTDYQPQGLADEPRKVVRTSTL
jgi:hypothetical protein